MRRATVRPRLRPPRRGFTILELLLALGLFMALILFLAQLLVGARRAADRLAERRAALELLDGAVERLRGLPPVEWPASGAGEVALAPPTLVPADARPADLALAAAAEPWPGAPQLVRVRVVCRWTGRDGRKAELAREVLLGPERRR